MIRVQKQLKEDGFTLPELTISLSVALVVSALSLILFIAFYGGILRADVESRLVVDSQILLRNLVDELRIATAIRENNLNPDTYAPGGGWATDLDNAILIVAIPARDENKDFIIDPLTGEPYENEIVYFAEGDVLYRRSIPHPDATGNTLGPTCPAANSTTSCIADRELSDDFIELEFVFYDQDNAVTTSTDLAESVEMNIELGRPVFSGEVNIQNRIRMTMRN
jgi:prepilin-type N-terminal cleavage/methylation domain-containing protein